MTWSGDGNGFKQAKEAASLLISALERRRPRRGDSDQHQRQGSFRLKDPKRCAAKRNCRQSRSPTARPIFPAALSKAYELLNQPAGQKEIRIITDMALTGWDQFSVAALKQADPSIPLKLSASAENSSRSTAAVKEIRLGGQGVGVNLPLQIEATVANFGGSGNQRAAGAAEPSTGRAKNRSSRPFRAKGETSVTFQTRIGQAGAHAGQITLKKDGFAGNSVAHFALDAQDKLRILLVDGDPQTSLVQSETFFLTRALNPAGERDSSLFLPTVVIARRPQRREPR